jgi:hypothetical protein
LLDAAEAVKEKILEDLSLTEAEALLIETEFSEKKSSIEGRFYLLLDEISVYKIIEAARETAAE